MGFEFDKDARYIMPVYYGPLQKRPGSYDMTPFLPMLQPADIEAFSVSFETDGELLDAILPRDFSIIEPIVTVMFCDFAHCGWLAGNSYYLINFLVPAHYEGREDKVDADFLLALFENHADPIITGRETLGYSKIYCDIPRFRKFNNRIIGNASTWGSKFLQVKVDLNGTCEDPETLRRIAARSAGKLNLKYIPATGEFGKADVCYPTLNPKEWKKPEGYPFELQKPCSRLCSGSIKIECPEWEEMPAPYYGFVKYMSELPIRRYVGAQYMTYSDPLDYSHVRRLS